MARERESGSRVGGDNTLWIVKERVPEASAGARETVIKLPMFWIVQAGTQ